MDNSKENGFGFKNLLVGLAAGTAVTMLILFIFAGVMYLADLDGTLASPLASVSLAFGAFAAGYYTSRKEGKRGLLNGISTSFVLFLIITIISIGVSTEKFGLLTLIHFVVLIVSGALGGIFGVNAKSSKRF